MHVLACFHSSPTYMLEPEPAQPLLQSQDFLPICLCRLRAHLCGWARREGGPYTTRGLGSASCQLPSSPHLPRTEDNATWLVAILSRSDFESKF